MVNINLLHNGNLGNKMIQYLYLKRLQKLISGAQIGNINLDQFGISYPSLPLSGRILRIENGHNYNIESIAYKLKYGIYDSMLFGGYVQRLEYFLDRTDASHIFKESKIFNSEYISERYITVNVRGLDVLRDTHPDYNPVPVKFFVDVVNSTKLEPVVMGQLGDDTYSEHIRNAFSGCKFLSHGTAQEDFSFVRQSRNVVFGVSTFSWMACWLSSVAKNIHMPVSGIFNPLQRPDINLLPIYDNRYTFYEFPTFSWKASSEQVEDLISQKRHSAVIDVRRLRHLIQ